jgi:hypothetical protein
MGAKESIVRSFLSIISIPVNVEQTELGGKLRSFGFDEKRG